MISVGLDGKTSRILLEQHNIKIKKLQSCFQLLTALSQTYQPLVPTAKTFIGLDLESLETFKILSLCCCHFFYSFFMPSRYSYFTFKHFSLEAKKRNCDFSW